MAGQAEFKLLFGWIGQEQPGFPGPSNLLVLLKLIAKKATTLRHFIYSLRS